ncbi:N-carbamoylputrescine amidase protein [Dioscorea alata]|uniref:N-carbamoylputrescine amidase protein n=2 Tax=Dioscorea alata TaxID=55571 RepID=A0ACB7W4X3_DIOAL|nr:N-carbamoylputrescine amidase protein [Dioscorea alata]KAH7682488.1 N-carbamoylputrescine amidase protein [Dioscorea alata]
MRVMQGHAGANLYPLLLQVPLVASIKLERRLLKLNMVTAPFPSMAFILGSIGETVALANNKDKDILGAKFDLNKVKSKRHNWGVFRDRRMKLYKKNSRPLKAIVRSIAQKLITTEAMLKQIIVSLFSSPSTPKQRKGMLTMTATRDTYKRSLEGGKREDFYQKKIAEDSNKVIFC